MSRDNRLVYDIKRRRYCPGWIKVLLIILAILSCLALFCAFTNQGRKFVGNVVGKIASELIFSNVNQGKDISGETPYSSNSGSSEMGGFVLNPENENTNTNRNKNVVNVLLLGIDLDPGQTSRSDTMMVASFNSETNDVKLVSFLRDVYVRIPEYCGSAAEDNKLNASFAKGFNIAKSELKLDNEGCIYAGAELVAKTISYNYDINIDGCAIVDYKAFESVIGEFGTVKIEITQEEADFLNLVSQKKYVYIMDPKDRNLVGGINMMNPAQVLAYCRVRGVPTKNGTLYDYGRTERQREVLKYIFNHYKEKNIGELYSILNACMPYVRTSENMRAIASKGISSLTSNTMSGMQLSWQERQCPNSAEILDDEAVVIIGGYKSEVLLPDWNAVRSSLSEFLYGE